MRERAEQANDVGLKTLAITDHYTISPHLSERMRTMAGVKIQADLHDTMIEILGYFPDPADEELKSVLEQL